MRLANAHVMDVLVLGFVHIIHGQLLAHIQTVTKQIYGQGKVFMNMKIA